MNNPKIPTISIVGRTNVGKSTLFNALVGHRASIVEDIAGVTRDRHYGYVSRFEFPFTLIDTGGLIGEEGSGLEDEVQEQARVAIEESDLALVIFDGIAGPHAYDGEIVKRMRRSGKKVLYVINKCEKPEVQVAANEFYRLGVPEASFVSAAHGVGVPELVEDIREALEIIPSEMGEHEKTKSGAIKIAIKISNKICKLY